MNAGSLDSLLTDLVNHSRHSDDLKHRLRKCIEEREVYMKKYAGLRKYYHFECSINDVDFECVGDYNEKEGAELHSQSLQCSLAFKEFRKDLRLSDPAMTTGKLLASFRKAWPAIKEKIVKERRAFLQQIEAQKVASDMKHAVNLVIQKKTSQTVFWCA